MYITYFDYIPVLPPPLYFIFMCSENKLSELRLDWAPVSPVSGELEGSRLQATYHSRLSPWCRARRAASGFWSWK